MALRVDAIDTFQRFNSGLALIDPTQQQAVAAQLARFAMANTAQENETVSARLDELAQNYGAPCSTTREKPYVFFDGVAIIPVQGVLINRFSYYWGYVTGYNYIRALANAARDDDDVTTIVYDCNTPGGEAAGCFELAAELREISLEKPTLAVVDSMCASAGYAIASAQRKIVCIPSGTVGSIGVIAIHFNYQKYLQDAGIDVTIVSEGPQKSAGNPYEPLSAEALADIQERIKQRYQMFIDLVVAGRGNKGLDESAIRATESRVYLGQDALDLKLIDAVATPAEAVSAFLAELGNDEPEDEGDDAMALKNEAEQQAAEAAAKASGITEGMAQGAKAERERVAAIMALPEAKDKQTSARNVAMKTGMTVDEAKAFLADQPIETQAAAPAPEKKEGDAAAPAPEKPAGEGAFTAAMNTGGGAGVVPNSESAATTEKPSRAQGALALAFGTKKTGAK